MLSFQKPSIIIELSFSRTFLLNLSLLSMFLDFIIWKHFWQPNFILGRITLLFSDLWLFIQSTIINVKPIIQSQYKDPLVFKITYKILISWIKKFVRSSLLWFPRLCSWFYTAYSMEMKIVALCTAVCPVILLASRLFIADSLYLLGKEFKLRKLQNWCQRWRFYIDSED